MITRPDAPHHRSDRVANGVQPAVVVADDQVAALHVARTDGEQTHKNECQDRRSGAEQGGDDDDRGELHHDPHDVEPGAQTDPFCRPPELANQEGDGDEDRHGRDQHLQRPHAGNCRRNLPTWPERCGPDDDCLLALALVEC
jgi:hypothetical protein